MKNDKKISALGVTSTQGRQTGDKNSFSTVADVGTNCQGDGLEKIIESINFRYGPGTLMRLGEAPLFHPVLSTGIEELDTALGIGGIPRGRIIEIFGSDTAGKTSLALQIAREAESVLYIDADHGLNPAQMIGLTIASADTLEDALNICEIAAPAFDLIVIDTVAALPTREDLTLPLGCEGYKKSTAVVLSRTLPRLIHSLAKHGCTLILVNQEREIPNVVYGNPLKSTGGRALKFYASVRLSINKLPLLCEKNKMAYAQKVRIRIVKNNCAPPFKEAEPWLLFETGIMTGEAVV